MLLGSLMPQTEYLTRGGESKVYLAADRLNVVKVNDAIYGKLDVALSQAFIEEEQAQLKCGRAIFY